MSWSCLRWGGGAQPLFTPEWKSRGVVFKQGGERPYSVRALRLFQEFTRSSEVQRDVYVSQETYPHPLLAVLAQLHRGDDSVEEGNTHPNSRMVLSGWNSSAKRSLGNVG